MTWGKLVGAASYTWYGGIILLAVFVIAGGVASNQSIRRALTRFCGEAGLPLIMPPPKLCTDNGAMIAWAGIEKLRLGLSDPLDFAARPRWPLDQKAERIHNGKA